MDYVRNLSRLSIIIIIVLTIIVCQTIISKNKITKYINKNFPLQNYILEFVAKFNEFTQDNPNWNKAFRGKDGWLFLGNDYNKTIDALRGADMDGPPRQYLFNLIHNLADNCKEANIPFMVVIGPNKSTIYPEYLPDWLQPVDSGVRNTLKASLEQKGISVFDPTPLLKSNKDKRLLYYRTDTHWNILAGSLVYNELKNFINSQFQLDFPPLPPHILDDGPTHTGDLVRIGNFSYLNIKDGDNFILKWETQPSLRRYSDNGTSHYLATVAMDMLSRKNPETVFQATGSIINNNQNHIDIIENSMPISQKTIVFFGDSFVAAISPFFNNVFKKTIYLYSMSANLWTAELLKYLNPDIVIFLCVERIFLS